VHYVGNALWITLGGEDRILPAAAVNRELEKRIAEIEEREGRKLGGRARKRLKEDVVAELLPRALVKPYRLNAYLDLKRGFLAVDTASRKAAESLVSHLRIALGSFPAVPVNAEVLVRATLTSWLAGEPLPAGLSLGDECELKDPVDGGGAVRCSRHELQADEIRSHLEAGKQVTRLALVLDDHVSFVLGEDLVLRKVKFLDGAVEALENTERDSLAAELDARFALMAGEVGRLFDLLERALQFSKAEG
jgi:recombination associated protein RdgC